MKHNPITISLFRMLNERKVEYCVLRNYETLPESTGSSDLDIYVPTEDRITFTDILREVCEETGAVLVSYKEDEMCPQYTLCSCSSGLQIDLHDGSANHRTCVYIGDELIRNNTFVTEKGIRALSPEVDGMMCFLKEMLNNKKCRLEYCEKASMAISGKSDEEIEQILKAFSVSVRKRIVDTLRQKVFEESHIRNLGTEASSDLQTFGSRVLYWYGQIKKVKRFIKPLGYTIAFLGTDGAGKSTIIDRVMPVLEEAFHKGVTYEHMRPNYLPSLAVAMGKRSKDAPKEVCDNPHGGKTSGFFGSLMRISYYWLDYTFGYMMKVLRDKSLKNHVWIFDRYYYDYIFDPERACISLPGWVLKFYGLVAPEPDIVICLGADAEVIHDRKPELPVEEVKRQVKLLQEFSNKNKRAVWVDTGCSVEESVKSVMSALLEKMGKRFKGVL